MTPEEAIHRLSIMKDYTVYDEDQDVIELAIKALKGMAIPVCTIKINPDRPKGEWIVEGNTTLNYVCSECGCCGDVWDSFCKHCGAEMESEE